LLRKSDFVGGQVGIVQAVQGDGKFCAQRTRRGRRGHARKRQKI